MVPAPDFHLHGSDIFIGNLPTIFSQWLEGKEYSKVVVLTDQNTQRDCLPLMAPCLPELAKIITIPAGEQHKSLQTCDYIWNGFLEHHLDRKALLINLGGGVVGDMGGFCAAVWKRGIDFIQVPTTLLAMTDAAIGGKTGVDYQGVKNIIGAFNAPAAVLVDPLFLQTLPERELLSGLAEVLKHGFIGDPELLEIVTKSHPTKWEHSDWTTILHKSIAVKVKVVDQDPFEKGLRALLNFGHSIGHALESYFLTTNSPITHGEAIAIGMICESPKTSRKRVADLIQAFFPKVAIPESAFPEIWQYMQQDKKNSSGAVLMAVPDEYPLSVKLIPVTETQLHETLRGYNV
ncbi:MAG: 3-dehydroquinate synthase [Saprospiraceae bacterium]|nr:3-dehydroquinate synthase [Saprospiraceae bacterium]